MAARAGRGAGACPLTGTGFPVSARSTQQNQTAVVAAQLRECAKRCRLCTFNGWVLRYSNYASTWCPEAAARCVGGPVPDGLASNPALPWMASRLRVSHGPLRALVSSSATVPTPGTGAGPQTSRELPASHYYFHYLLSAVGSMRPLDLGRNGLPLWGAS